MIYGYKEMVDNRPATMVVAAETVDEYTNFCDTIREMDVNDEETKFVEIYTSNFLDAMRDDRYRGYKNPVLCIYHTDEEQRDEFNAKYGIVEVMSAVGRDRQLDMLHAKKVEIEEQTLTEEEKNMTIEERFGLDKVDPWDRRSEEEKAADEDMKKKMRDLQKKGEISGDSFGGADDQRASRERFNGDPLSRSEAIEKLKEVYGEEADCADDIPDFEEMSNTELSRAYNGIDELDAALRPVFDDDKMPTEKVDNGVLQVTGVKAEHNEDGSIDLSSITSISAVKHGGQVDETLKAEREAAHQAQVDEAKAGRKSFDPGDFAKVLRGDGSADHLSGTMGDTFKGDDRIRRGEGIARPSLSEAAEAARKAYQEEQDAAADKAARAAKVEDDIRAKKERDAGIFRGAALEPDDELPFDELSEELRKELEEAGMKRDSYGVKNYPYNSQLADRVILPYDVVRSRGGYRVLGGDNIEIEGSVQLGDSAAMVVSKKDKEKEALVVYGRQRTIEGSNGPETKLDVSLVRIR